ncbi:hypothetical protein [Rhodococcus qingshengii]|uniref:hypothetical protein n=1 Tax=Rhodococcus qingshengii TaxID=334542 RepID=UPI001F1455BB|nr:hypothetical protein [Rhodococcus qingshengii]ULD38922.1 hypothetical protein JKI97_01090 [Rhodococcus qingshengii]
MRSTIDISAACSPTTRSRYYTSGRPTRSPAVTTAAPDISWTVVELWCPRDVMIERVTARGTGDIDERIAAYDQTPPLHGPTLRVSTATLEPAAIARWIDVLIRGSDL